RLSTLEDATRVDANLAIRIRKVGPVAHQAAGQDCYYTIFPAFTRLNPRSGWAKSGWRHSGRECDALARSACELVHTAGVAYALWAPICASMCSYSVCWV